MASHVARQAAHPPTHHQQLGWNLTCGDSLCFLVRSASDPARTRLNVSTVSSDANTCTGEYLDCALLSLRQISPISTLTPRHAAERQPSMASAFSGACIHQYTLAPRDSMGSVA